MDKDIVIRDESPSDEKGIADVTMAAFATLEISNQTEHFIIDALRKVGALAVSLVAVSDGKIVGHIAFSPVTMSDGTDGWYGLGPVSVLPERHRQGIGTALIHEGLSRLQSMGARGICVVGHPDYYIRFGFRNAPELTYEGVPAYVFFVLSFDGHVPRGSVQFHPAFQLDEPMG